MKLVLKGIILLILMVLSVNALAAFPEITQVSYNPSPAIPGSTITVLVQIENKDATAQAGVSVQVSDEYPFSVKQSTDNPNPKTVGDMSAFGKALAQYTVYVDPSAENKTYNLPITVTIKGDTTGKKTTFPIVISGKEPIVKVLSTSNDKLLPGEEKSVTLDLQNVGTSPAYDLVVEMQEDRTVTATGAVIERDITPMGAAAAYLPSLNPGEKKSVSLKVSVSSTATIKNYTQPIKVSYRNAAGTRTTDTSYIGLTVFGNANIDATLKETTGVLSANQKGDITIEIFNKGLGKAEFMVVELSTTDGKIEKPKQFIGALGPNDVDTVKTGVTFTTQGDHIIKATITYQDADSTTQKISIDVPVKTTAQTSEGINPILILAAIVIIGFLVWNFFLKGKNKK